MRHVIAALEGEGSIKEKLLSAANAFWSATYHIDTWPKVLRPQAEALIARLLGEGPIPKTIEMMDEWTAQETADQLLTFAREFETLDA